MARFYFHLSTPDEYFYDTVGRDLRDVVAAHSVAARFADRVMIFVPFFLNHAVDFRRWTVEVTNESDERVGAHVVQSARVGCLVGASLQFSLLIT